MLLHKRGDKFVNGIFMADHDEDSYVDDEKPSANLDYASVLRAKNKALKISDAFGANKNPFS
ncbi:hypothetical protein M8C21_025839 [Ambrosia artemisiifolia]|uniref:Uncharacterized protein n=1 Tax=Ambrosia artemisiifolia TaxID=4212 RepID=A0AAD5G8X3_AMBAR|nr:hypothetical protein M8C21_025839 [Ambrosia artemisiifolia]